MSLGPSDAALPTQVGAAATGSVVLPRQQSILYRLRIVLRESNLVRIGAGIVIFWALACVLAPWLTPYGPNQQDVAAVGTPTPSWAHPLGTDLNGRDIWARLIYGARTVLILAPLSLLVAYTLGIAIGLISGYYGGWIDTILTRISDVILAFPVIVLYILLITAIGPSVINIVLAVTLSSAPGIGRIMRGLTLDLKSREFVDAARVRGESGLYILVVEILPNARGILMTDACLRMGYTIIKIGVLGFLGLGLPPPDPDWGGMVKDSTAVMLIWPHMSLFPCLAILSLAMAFNLIADGLNESAAKR